MSKSNDWAEALILIVGAVALTLLVFLFNVWLLMILLGAVHSFMAVVPALGLGETALFAVLLASAGAFWNGSASIKLSKSN